jgi:glycine/D-amino acid oxidase-like deaminating enzyme
MAVAGEPAGPMVLLGGRPSALTKPRRPIDHDNVKLKRRGLDMARPIVVVGGGIVGTAVAWQLQVRGAETTLVCDVEDPGASYFSFASLSTFDEPLSVVYALKSFGISYWRRWESELGGDIGLRWEGEIRWAETPESAQVLLEKSRGRTSEALPYIPFPPRN